MFLFLHFVIYFCITRVIVFAGVYPNYHANGLDFVTFDDKIQEKQKSWWQTASFYQIYPRSFQDSNDDGIGDLNGITSRLAYLKEIGVTATWLSPIFKSPMADFGYDIANFTDIDPIFGTMKDFDALIEKSKKIGIKIILDFVPNHSSDECIWFQKSIERDPKYEHFYIWHPGKMINGKRYPPSNWISVFRGSAWTWNEKRKEYYLHQFVSKQPDLNYRNPKVHETMKEILRFWLKKGVAGFRIDAVPHLYEIAPDDKGNYLDEPRQEWVTDPDDYGYLQHIYTVNQPETLNTVYEWRQVLDEFQKENGGEERIMMTEAYAPVDILMKYYGNGTAEGSQIPFNFLLITSLNKNSNAYDYLETINTWLENMPEGRTANWVMGNHDKNRIGSRLGEERIDMWNMILLTLPGCSITYMGEEIGMTDVWISWNDTVDPSACNSNPSIYEKLSRDPERTPFQWNDEKNAGFSTANKTWLPVAPKYSLVNVKRERGITKSHLNLYKELKNIRQENVFQNGETEIHAISENVLAIKRSLLNDYVYITLINVMANIENVNLNAAFNNLPTKMEYSVVTDKSARRKSDKTFTDSVALMPWESVILRSITKLKTTFGYYTYFAEEE